MTPVESEQARTNRLAFFDSINLRVKDAALCKLSHGNTVAIANAGDAEQIFWDTDALATNEKNLCLSVTMSDCIPVYFYDPANQAIGIAHAGWRGVVGKICVNVIDALAENFGSQTESLQVHIGPHIRACHFEIQKDVLPQFTNHNKHIKREGGQLFVNLESIVREQLQERGVIQITSDNICTYCDESFFSYRRDKSAPITSQLAYIMLI